MHFLSPFFPLFLELFLEPFFWHSFEHFFWGLFQHFFIGLFWKPFLALLWVLFYGNELSLSPFRVLYNVTGLLCSLLLGLLSILFVFLPFFSAHFWKCFGADELFFWQHLMSSEKCLDFFKLLFDLVHTTFWGHFLHVKNSLIGDLVTH